MKYDVLVLGNATVDLVFTGLPALPELGKEVYSTGFDMIPGESYNSAVAMHRLGLRVGWAADFGNDQLSRLILEFARQEGMDEAFFVHHQRPYRRISVAVSFPDERSFITYYDPEPSISASIKSLAVASARCVYVPGFYYGTMFDAGLKLIHLKHMKLVMDGNSGIDLSLETAAVRRAAESVDVLLLNANEARRLTRRHDLAETMLLLSALCPLVVVKDGQNGAYGCLDGEITHSPAIPVLPIDTTGAGDCFNAGFLAAWLDEKPLTECLRWGNITGGLSTTARGATGRVVTRRDIEQFTSKSAGQ